MKKAFTLIELLVTITIIAVLAVAAMVNFKVANEKARDGRRQADLAQIQAALELYRTDLGVYPTDAQFPAVGHDLVGGIPSTTYMSSRPGDPSSGRTYYYHTADAGKTYILCAALELTTTGVCSGAGANACGTGVACNYPVTNPL